MKSEIIGFVPEAASSTHALRPFRPEGRVFQSELPGVSHEAWTEFVFAMKVASLNAVSPSNGLGMFDLRYKRLAELKLVTNVSYKRDVITNRSVQVADWVPPLTKAKFLTSANAQYKTFAHSMRDYYTALSSGSLARPQGVSLSGALAILHRGGRGALAKWGEPGQQFEATAELVKLANGVF